MRLNPKSLILLAAMVCSVAASTRGSLRRRLSTKHQRDLVASPEAALHTEFLKEATKKGKVNSEVKEPKGGAKAPAPTKAPTLPEGSLPSARPPTVQKTKQPTVEKTKQPTVEKTKQPTVEKTKQPTVEKTKQPTVEKTKGAKGDGGGGGKAPSPTKAPSMIKGSPPSKTPKGDDSGGSNGKTDKGDKEKKGGRGAVDGDGAGAGSEVTGGDSFLGKFNRFDSLLSMIIFLSAALT
jgi:outer membrane biosynthesis protein TonB